MTDFIYASDIVSAVSQAECAELARLAKDKIVLELGSDYGRSTIALASVAEKVVSVDFFLDYFSDQRHTDDLQKFFTNIKRYNVWPKITHIVGDYTNIANRLISRQFDLIFIDGIHFHEYVLRDLLLSLALVKIPGTIAFHDYNISFESRTKEQCVNTVVDKFSELLGVSFSLVETLAIVPIPKLIHHPEYE
jgi:predicted O-methyltransferase YrrM